MVTHLPSMYVNFIKVTLAPTLAGHCYRHPERPANKVIICKPEHCRRDPGRPAKIMVKMMIEHAVVETMEALVCLVTDRDVWSVRHPARLKSHRCRDGHGFDTCRGLRFFLCLPTHEHYIFLISLPSLTFTTILYLSV